VNDQRASRWAIIGIVLLFIVLSLAYSVANPLHEATDELRHYRFVQHIVQRSALPEQGKVGCSAQGHHPPLYYSLAALATSWIDTGRDVCYEPTQNPFWAYRYWEVGNDNKNQYLHTDDEAFPWYGEALAVHLARAVNILIGAAVVCVTWAIGRTIWPRSPYLAVGGAAIVAFNPMFLFMSGAINNDVIAALAGAAVTLASVRLLRDQEGLRLRWGVVLGLLYSLALMSKFNLAAIAVTIELAVTWVAWRKQQWPRWFQVNLLILLFTLLVSGWWFLRNQMLYGEPTGFQRLTELWGARDPIQSLGVALFELSYLWTTLWGRFGYGQVPLPQALYDTLWWLAVFAMAGLLIPILLRQKEEIQKYGIYLALLLLNTVLFFAVVFNYLLVSPAGPMGRFFFPALPSLALLLFYGLSRWVSLLPKVSGKWGKYNRTNHVLTALVTICLFGLALVALFGYLAPAYAQPPQFAAQAELPNPIDAQFDSLVKLPGYEINSDNVSAGDSVDLRLFWEVTGEPPGDFLQFVHLIDGLDTMVMQRDTHPGLGSFPSSQWQIGDRFIDTVRLHIPQTAYTPAQATLSVGFYAPLEGYRLGIEALDGTDLGDALEVGTVTISPASSTLASHPNPLEQNFANEILLTGYEYSRREIRAGEPLKVVLYWQALQSDLPDYEVQLRLLDESGQIIKTVDSRPRVGQSPTTTWQAGQVVVDSHELPLRSSLSPGTYYVQVSLKNTDTRQRLNIVAEDGHWLDDRLRLAGLKVVP
jgi:hypothetical protein